MKPARDPRRRNLLLTMGLACLVMLPAHADAGPASGSGKDFSLTLRSETDPLVAGSSVFLYATVFHVDGASGRAELAINRHQAGTPHPVGLFAETLDAARVEALAAALAAIDWSALPPGEGGDPSAANLTLEYVRGAKSARHMLNARNANVLAALRPVMAQIDELETRLLKKPRKALALTVARSGTAFKVSWRNVGTGPITIADPRAAASGNGGARSTASTRGFVKVWEVPVARPGYDPPRATKITLPLVSAGSSDKPVTIAPGQAFEALSEPFQPTAGEQAVQASWIDYEGPAHSPPASASLSEQAWNKHPFLIRGAAYSENTKVSADGSR